MGKHLRRLNSTKIIAVFLALTNLEGTSLKNPKMNQVAQALDIKIAIK